MWNLQYESILSLLDKILKVISNIRTKDMIGNLNGRLGEDDYSEPLEILIKSANKHNKFNLFGTFAFKNQLKDRLKMRCKLHNFMKDKALPSPADPIFVTGLPRSGTTFLFNILALDKNHRSPKYWEIMSPLPLAKSNFDIKKREWKINAELKFARTIIPKLRSMHHIRAQTPEECELLATINVRSFVYMCMANVPEYVEYLEDYNLDFETILPNQKFDIYLQVMNTPGVYGQYLEINSFCELFKLNVIILTNENNIHVQTPSKASKKNIFLFYHEDIQHYDVLYVKPEKKQKDKTHNQKQKNSDSISLHRLIHPQLHRRPNLIR